MESEAKLIICNKFFFVHTHTYTQESKDMFRNFLGFIRKKSWEKKWHYE